jgi:hypothetical protein
MVVAVPRRSSSATTCSGNGSPRSNPFDFRGYSPGTSRLQSAAPTIVITIVICYSYGSTFCRTTVRKQSRYTGNI